MEDLKEIIAANITNLRKGKNLTQAELAEKLNYSDKAISKWERGESIPDITVLKDIADLFEVTVDYLITQDHKKSSKIISIIKKKNRFFISLLGISPIWTLATIAFYIIWLLSNGNRYYWLTFIYAIPPSLIVAIIFNSIWGKRKINFYLISALVWSILGTFYLAFLKYNLWMMFIIGIPAQIIIIIWSKIKKE